LLAPTGAGDRCRAVCPNSKPGEEGRPGISVAAHLKANNVASTDAFSAYSFDGWLVFADRREGAHLASRRPPGTGPPFPVGVTR